MMMRWDWRKLMMSILKKILSVFFCKEGQFAAGGLFSAGHFILLATTIFFIYKALNKTLQYSFQKIRGIIKKLVITMTIFELAKIAFHFIQGDMNELKDWVPLYFCSIFLYAGWLSVFAKGFLRHAGDVFLASGSLIGGICFLLYPSSSLLLYPSFHFLCFHSFLYHGVMVYIGVLMNRSGLVNLKKEDMHLYFWFTSLICILAWIINLRYGTNFMFISDTFHGTLLDIPYRVLGPFYTPVLILVQAIVPFRVIQWFRHHTSLLTRPAWYPDTCCDVVNNGKIRKEYKY